MINKFEYDPKLFDMNRVSDLSNSNINLKKQLKIYLLKWKLKKNSKHDRKNVWKFGLTKSSLMILHWEV